MERVIDFRRHADECRLLAAKARAPEERKMLTAMQRAGNP